MLQCVSALCYRGQPRFPWIQKSIRLALGVVMLTLPLEHEDRLQEVSRFNITFTWSFSQLHRSCLFLPHHTCPWHPGRSVTHSGSIFYSSPSKLLEQQRGSEVSSRLLLGAHSPLWSGGGCQLKRGSEPGHPETCHWAALASSPGQAGRQQGGWCCPVLPLSDPLWAGLLSERNHVTMGQTPPGSGS